MKIRTVFTTLLLLTILSNVSASTATADHKLAELYSNAIKDVAIAKPNEIFPLIEITKESPYMIWNETGDKVLLVYYTQANDCYKEGSIFHTTPEKEIWLASTKEYEEKFNGQSHNIKNWSLRFEQLLGLPPKYGCTHFIACWVKPEDLVRPAYQSDITKQLKAEDFKGNSLGENGLWFISNMSYFIKNKKYPWTRLGYTYDWSEESKNHYGLTEFLVKPGSDLEIAWVKTTEEYVKSFK